MNTLLETVYQVMEPKIRKHVLSVIVNEGTKVLHVTQMSSRVYCLK